MTLPGTAAADPFGLWQAPPAGAVSFSTPGTESAENRGDEEAPALVWTLNLDESGAGQAELDRRAAQMQALERGLVEADERMAAFLAAPRAGKAGASFAAGESASLEQRMAFTLARLETAGQPVEYGIREDVAAIVKRIGAGGEALAALPGVDLDSLRARLEALLELVNRRMLHMAWVETTLDGRLAARTTLGWTGDMHSWMLPGLLPAQNAAHQRSLALAMESSAANLNTLITVLKLAVKISLAVTTPLGVVAAVSLAWQFVHEVVMPLVNEATAKSMLVPAASGS